MRILIARHADPDYAVDGLTEVGKREAELLSRRLVKENITHVYCSPIFMQRDWNRLFLPAFANALPTIPVTTNKKQPLPQFIWGKGCCG